MFEFLKSLPLVTYTRMLMVVGLGLYILWDIFAESRNNDATISEVTLSATWHYKIILLALAIVVGHVSWPRDTPWTWHHPLLIAALGYLLGHLLWPQTLSG
jgi:hypothetical protein